MLKSEIETDKWYEVTNEKEAEELLEITGAFHDAYIIGMDYKGSSDDIDLKTKIHLTFKLLGGRIVVLEFAGNVSINYSFFPNFNYIYLSSIVFDKNNVYWVEGSDEYRLCDIDEKSEYFKADQLRWKMLSDIDR